MEAKLIVVGGKASKRDVPLKLPTTIGRSRQADLTVAHPMVSRQHCELYEEDGVLKLRDLGSLNGTFIEGKRISEACLRPDMQFAVGPLTFRADYEYAGDVESIPLPEGVGEQEPAEAAGEAPDFQAVEPQAGIEATPDAGQVPGLVPGIAPESGEMPDFAAWSDSDAAPADQTPVVQPEPEAVQPEVAPVQPEVAPVQPEALAEAAPVAFEPDEPEDVEPTPPPSVQAAAAAPEAEPLIAEPESEEPSPQATPEQAAAAPVEGVEEPVASQPAEDEAEPPVLFDMRDDAPLVPPEEVPEEVSLEMPAEEAAVEETIQVEVPEAVEPEPGDAVNEEPAEVFALDDDQESTDDELSEDEDEDEEEEEEEAEEVDAKVKKRRWWPFGKGKSKKQESEPDDEPEEEPEEDQPEADEEAVGPPAEKAPAFQEPVAEPETAGKMPDFLVGGQAEAEADKSEPESDEGLDDFFKGLS